MSAERPPRLALWIGIIAATVGLLCGIGFGVLGASRAVPPISDASEEVTDGYPIPGEQAFRGEGLAAIVTRSPEAATFTCDVTDAKGFLVKTEQSTFGSSGTNKKGHVFQMQGAFQADAGTEYTVRCKGDDVGATFEIALIPTSAILALFAAFVGGAIFVFGLIMLIVAFVRRRSWRRSHELIPPPPAPGGSPFGGPGTNSPDPSQQWNLPSSRDPYPPSNSLGGPVPPLPPPRETGPNTLPPAPSGPPGQGQLPQRYPQRPPEDQ